MAADEKIVRSNIYSGSTIKDSQSIPSHAQGSYFKKDRINMLTSQVAGEFNTYRNWKEFDLEIPKFSNGKDLSIISKGKGLKSLFSSYAAVYGELGEKNTIREDMNSPLLDSPSIRQKLRDKTNCSIKTLVEQSSKGNLGRAIYNYSDFMYCKHLGKIPNNHLITLRKFPSGCGDHINFSNVNREMNSDTPNKHLPDMGRLITWIGVDGNTMENVLKYSYKLPWQDNKAPVNEQPSKVGGESKALGKIMATMNDDYAKKVQQGYASNPGINPLGGSDVAASYDVNAGLSNSNRIMSDMQNTIQKVIVPGGKDGGMEFEHNITLTFNYELRSYDGINPKSAMLDLLGNILMVTYMQGKFFGGSYAGVDTYHTNAYANLDIFKQASDGNIRTPADLINSAWNSVTQIKDSIIGDATSAEEALKKIGGNMMQIFVGNLLTSIGRPERFSMTSMISPTPTGQWHLTIGNPRNPILSIGNLILKNSTIEHYGPLGIDDFPSGIKVTVELEHAKPRDSVAIEQMYMQGNARIYTPMNDKIETMYKDATEYKSSELVKLDESQKGGDRADISPYSNSTSIEIKTGKAGLYNKLFGTTDVNMITIASKENMVGAHKAKEKQSADKNKSSK